MIAQKASLLVHQNISPIVCFGEDLITRNTDNTNHVLKEQLSPLVQVLSELTYSVPIYFAYEPLWAIGTGITPTLAELGEVLVEISSFLKQHAFSQPYKILYGGSVDSSNIAMLKKSQVDGFLLGKASANFQELKKIVSCLSDAHISM
jgi:triosephosphate isomerase